nr:hypothetical protein [Mangrovihabitans endophyticus]
MFELGELLDADQPAGAAEPGGLVPPLGIAGYDRLYPLIHTVPAWSARASRQARSTSLVHTPMARPYGVALARRTASASSANGSTVTTGPNSSCWTSGEAASTPVTTAGAEK